MGPTDVDDDCTHNVRLPFSPNPLSSKLAPEKAPKQRAQGGRRNPQWRERATPSWDGGKDLVLNQARVLMILFETICPYILVEAYLELKLTKGFF